MATRYDREYERRPQDSTYREEPGHNERSYDDDRGLLNRASDEVRSWFGDEEADRRRRMDERLLEQRYREGRYARSQHDIDDVRALDLMTRNVVTIRPNDTVERAARLMGDCDCGALPVTDTSGRLIGMVTDRDIAVRVAGRGIDPQQARVNECMTDETFACHANDSIKECMRQMARHQIRRLPVVNNRNQLVGIVSQADLARHAGAYQGRGERRAMADTLCSVSEPTREAYRY
jgi:CBS domain-containing protein